MERRVEARDLRQLRTVGEQRPDRREIVRLVQWRQRHVFLERREYRRVDAHGQRVIGTSMHHAMSDADQAMLCQVHAQELDQMPERTLMPQSFAVAPRLLA